MSVVDIVVMGANGRMGSTLATLAKADPELRLAGVVERPGHEDRLERWGCKVSTDLAKLLPELPGAVVVDFTAPEASVATAGATQKNRQSPGHRHHRPDRGAERGP